MSTYKEMDQTVSLLKEAEGKVLSLVEELSVLRLENSQLLTKLAETSNVFKFAEVVDDMVEMGIVDSALRHEKIEELMNSGSSPDIYKEAINLVPTFHSLGHLDSAIEEDSIHSNPMELAIMDYVQSKTL
jgi:hypothetical protein